MPTELRRILHQDDLCPPIRIPALLPHLPARLAPRFLLIALRSPISPGPRLHVPASIISSAEQGSPTHLHLPRPTHIALSRPRHGQKYTGRPYCNLSASPLGRKTELAGLDWTGLRAGLGWPLACATSVSLPVSTRSTRRRPKAATSCDAGHRVLLGRRLGRTVLTRARGYLVSLWSRLGPSVRRLGPSHEGGERRPGMLYPQGSEVMRR